MSRAYSYLQSAKQIVEAYQGHPPFATWLKQYFAANKKFGSRDRKVVSQLCFAFYRLGRAFQQLPTEERIIKALYLTAQEPSVLLEAVAPRLNETIHLPLDEKWSLLGGTEKEVNQIFPLASGLSEEIDLPAFSLSHLVQPLLYLRLRPGKEEKVQAQLREADIPFEKISTHTLALANSSRANEVLMLNRDAVVQDRNSQRVLDLLPEEAFQAGMHVWDCCAASGGKSLLLFDRQPKINLTVSDVRSSILANLKKRFEEAGQERYRSFTADLSANAPALPLSRQSLDLIVCDAPCSGSGTWGRTPEQLLFFSPDKLEHYTRLQQQIVCNTIPYLKKGGYLLYITCSVYRKENEALVEMLTQQKTLQLVQSAYLKGWREKADTLFAAAFRL